MMVFVDGIYGSLGVLTSAYRGTINESPTLCKDFRGYLA